LKKGGKRETGFWFIVNEGFEVIAASRIKGKKRGNASQKKEKKAGRLHFTLGLEGW